MAQFTSRKQKKDIKVTFAGSMLYVEWEGGKPQAFALTWLPKLQNASEQQQQDWVLTATGIRWNALNEEIAITGL